MKKARDTNELEQQLGSLFEPVSPQTDFISELQARLKKKALVVIEQPDYLILVLLILSGLVFGAFIYWMVKKIFKIFKIIQNNE